MTATKPRGAKPKPKERKPDSSDKFAAMLGDLAPKPDPRPVGRPSVYNPSMCQQVIEWGKLGKSKAWMAAELHITRDTLWQWISVYPEFSDAIQIAELHSQKWWEDMGQQGMLMPGFNAGIWTKSMNARFRKDWGETKTTEITGAGGGPIEVSVQKIDVNNLPARTLDALEQALQMLEQPGDTPGEVIEGEAVEEQE